MACFFITIYQYFCCAVSELNDKHGWQQHDFAKTFDVSHSTVNDTIPRENVDELDVLDFIEKYERVIFGL